MRRLTSEHRRKISLAQIGKILSLEHKQNISNAMKGRRPVTSPSIIAKIVATRKERGILPPFLGRGKDSPFWRGGRSAARTRWKHKNKDRVRLYHVHRRAIIRNSVGVFTVNEWSQLKETSGFTCNGCGRKEPEITLTVDHIIPISKGGANDIRNIQPLCKSCNSRKWNRIIN